MYLDIEKLQKFDINFGKTKVAQQFETGYMPAINEKMLEACKKNHLPLIAWIQNFLHHPSRIEFVQQYIKEHNARNIGDILFAYIEHLETQIKKTNGSVAQ